MGKQTEPKTFNNISTHGLTRRDAIELYAETPKRALFDALWDLVNKTGDHCNGDDAAVLASIWSLTRNR